jgi:hypothetical protein
MRRIEDAVLTTPQQILAFLRDCVFHCNILVIMIESGSDRLDFEFIENTTVPTSQICICQITTTSQVQSASATDSVTASAAISASSSTDSNTNTTASSIATVSRMCRLDVVRVAETT